MTPSEIPKKGNFLEILLRKGGDRHEAFFFWSGLCIFLYFCTFKGEICAIYNTFRNFKAILMWYLSGRQSKHAVFSKLEKRENLRRSVFFKVGGGMPKRGNQTPFRTWKIHWRENGNHSILLPGVDFFIFIFEHFSKIFLMTITTIIFSTSTKSLSNSNAIKSYRHLKFNWQLIWKGHY